MHISLITLIHWFRTATLGQKQNLIRIKNNKSLKLDWAFPTIASLLLQLYNISNRSQQHRKKLPSTDTNTKTSQPSRMPRHVFGFLHHMTMSLEIKFDFILSQLQAKIFSSSTNFSICISSFQKSLSFLCFQMNQTQATHMTLNFIVNDLPIPFIF